MTLSSVDHPCFSRFFNWLASRGPGRGSFAALRRATAGKARGVTLELGAGGGPNFAYYDPALVARVEATEPDATMLGFARQRAAQASVPITLTQAAAEALPFGDDTFDTAVMTLVFCSVADPERSLRELLRTLKPGGRLLMAEHVRSSHAALAATQSALVPLRRASPAIATGIVTPPASCARRASQRYTRGGSPTRTSAFGCWRVGCCRSN